MNRLRLVSTISCLIPLAFLTACNPKPPPSEPGTQTILVSPGGTGPLWQAGDVLTWRKQTGSPDFIVYVLPGTCKEATSSTGGPQGTVALPRGETASCTILPQQKETAFSYYIAFPALNSTGPAQVDGPFAARVGGCKNCPTQ